MRSDPLKAPMRLSILLPLVLGCAACVSAPPTVATPNACASLLPEQWKAGVPGAPLPDGETVGDWIAFGDAQTAQLDKANDRTASAIGIVERCEARDAAAVKRARRRFLGIF
mgnify:CR=1 FL=1